MERCVIREHEVDIPGKDQLGEETVTHDLRNGRLRINWRNDYGPRPGHFDALKDELLTLFVLKNVN